MADLHHSRRKFIKTTAAGAGAMLVTGFLSKLGAVSSSFNAGNRVLVLVELGGGNDGLNTVVPYRNDIYYRSRPKIAVPPQEVLDLDGNLGLHPALKGLKSIWDRGELTILNNVGYPNHDRSHFKSILNMQQGLERPINGYFSGWVGRYLDHYGHGKPWIALDVNAQIPSPALKGENITGVPLAAQRTLFDFTEDAWYYHQGRHFPKELTTEEDFLYQTLSESFKTGDYLKSQMGSMSRTAAYPEKNKLARSLKNTADLIVGGAETKVYFVRMGGFDTHSTQKNPHRKLMTELGDALGAFAADLRKNNQWKNTAVFTYSEFGRRVQENKSQGTDHGKACPMFLMGGSLYAPGIFNDGPDLANLDGGDVKFTVDFRAIYSSLLRDWLGADPRKILQGNFVQLDLMKRQY